jgi:outer membrane lipoprotein-sorting protein
VRRRERVGPLAVITLGAMLLFATGSGATQGRQSPAAVRPATAVPSVLTTPPAESFDRLYEQGQRANASIRTLTARFTETTTSSLLVRPLVARGTLAVERPSRVVLRYTEPESRVVLIDNNKMTMSWPSYQVMDIGSAMGRVQRYFVDGSAADLRRQFDIDDSQAGEKPGLYRVVMVPKQKRIREALSRLELSVTRETMLLASMRMTFANGDTKTMALDNVTPNAPLPAGTFVLERR